MVSPQVRNAPVVLWPMAGALLVFSIVLGLFAAGDSTLQWDIEVSLAVQKWDGVIPQRLYQVGEILGGTVLAVIIAVFGLITSIVMRNRLVAMFLSLVILLRLAGTQLKPLFDSPRPSANEVRLLEIFDGTGYPSGHSTTAAMLATTAVLLMWHCSQSSTVRGISAVIAILGMALVGWSRIWAGAHWPTDVLGGWGFGTALGLIAWLVATRFLTTSVAESSSKV